MFPDYISSANVRVDPNKSIGWNTGEYNTGAARGLQTRNDNQINVAPKGDARGWDQFTTPRVMDTLDTILHEIHHARSDTTAALTDSGGAQKKLGNLEVQLLGRSKVWETLDVRSLIRKAANALEIPSTAGDARNSLEEILATVIPALDAKARGINLPQLAAAETIKSIDPKIAEWISKNVMPEQGSWKSEKEYNGKFSGVEIDRTDVERIKQSPVIRKLLGIPE